jgi:hypothetical protein
MDGRRRRLEHVPSQEAVHASETTSVLWSGRELALRLRDGSRWFVRVLVRKEAAIVVRPWGWRSTRTIMTADVASAVLIQQMPYEKTTQIAAAQRAAEGRSP